MKKLQLGIVNIMPKAQEYASMLNAAFGQELAEADVHYIRLRDHPYRSSDVAGYAFFDELIRDTQLDLLLMTGAPVEHLPFAEIHYMAELERILAYAAGHCKSVFGLCFGALALGKYLGVGKRQFDDKIFGVYAMQKTSAASAFFAEEESIQLALSTWALLNEDELSAAKIPLQAILTHPQWGHLMLASRDRRFVLMLGHPEYQADTLLQEWQRDTLKQIAYTRRFKEADFVEMGEQMRTAPCPLLRTWLRSWLRSWLDTRQ